MKEKQFFFEVSRAFQQVLYEAKREEQCDGFHAYLAGLNELERFIKIEET